MLPAKEACTRLGVSRWTLKNLCKQGKLDYVRYSDTDQARYYVSEVSINDFIDARKRAAERVLRRPENAALFVQEILNKVRGMQNVGKE